MGKRKIILMSCIIMLLLSMSMFTSCIKNYFYDGFFSYTSYDKNGPFSLTGLTEKGKKEEILLYL